MSRLESAKRVRVPGSERRPRPTYKNVGPANPREPVRVVIKLRPKNELPDPEELGSLLPTQRGSTPSYAEHVDRFGASEADVDAVVEFARAHGLNVAEASAAQRLVVLTGAVKEMNKAFGTDLQIFKSQATGESYRGRVGQVQIPESLSGIVTAVTGLDNRQQVKPRQVGRHAAVAHRSAAAARKARAAQRGATAGGRAAGAAGVIDRFDAATARRRRLIHTSFTAPQLAQLYDFPAQLDGTGQCIGLLEFGGGFVASDLSVYFQEIGVPAPSVTAISVDGTPNSPGSDADGEVMLDIEVAGGVAPGASIAVYFAQFTDAGWVEALTKAVHDTQNRPSVLSISWGYPEFEGDSSFAWTEQVMEEVNRTLKEAAQLGVTVIVAAGDDGSIDAIQDGKAHVDFPASSPFVLSCGGTTLQARNGAISSEVVWSDGIRRPGGGGSTGGGVSEHFPVPDWQTGPGINVPKSVTTNFAGRGVPDVAADADGRTGYFYRVDGQDGVNGGTSASTPLWAGLIARINQRLATIPGSTAVGYFNPLLYQKLGPTAAFNDITVGSNDALGTLNGAYAAGPGWDACTGWGSPNGSNLLQALTGGAAGPTNGAAVPPSSVAASFRGNGAATAKLRDELMIERATNRQLLDTFNRLARVGPAARSPFLAQASAAAARKFAALRQAASAARQKHPHKKGGPADGEYSHNLIGPGDRLFGEVKPGSDENAFQQDNTSEAYYKSPYYLLHQYQIQPVPPPRLSPSTMNISDVVGPEFANAIRQAGKIVFHCVGDTGAAKVNRSQTAGTAIAHEASVADEMTADIQSGGGAAPSFFYHLGDVIYYFGEGQYYYDQFYEPFRGYDRPIFAIPGNHDGMVFGNDPSVPQVPTLDAFLRNFAADGPNPSPDSGGLVRSAMTQPGVYFTLDAPFVSIIGLYSNVLEGPGVISSQGGAYPIGNDQLTFLQSELTRLKPMRAAGERAVLLAVHHPPVSIDSKHGGTTGLANDIDAACKAAGFWPDAILSGHAHLYQRFARRISGLGRDIPYVVSGSGGFAATKPQGAAPRPGTRVGEYTLATAPIIEFGYLTITVDMTANAKALTISFNSPKLGRGVDSIGVQLS